MAGLVERFVCRVRREAQERSEASLVVSGGKSRSLVAFDWGADTFVFEKGIWRNIEQHAPVLCVRKSVFRKGAEGRILTMTTGNHATAAVPLLSGKLWSLGEVPKDRRSAVLAQEVVCANVVNGKIEISQRDVPAKEIIAADEWMQAAGLSLDAVVLAERNDEALGYYRNIGQEWRIKPLAWTRKEIDFALRTSRTRINTRLEYYHSAKGVHFLSYSGFHRMGILIESDFGSFVECMRELVSIAEGSKESFTRMQKFHGHHEVELFGMRRGTAQENVIPRLERLMEAIALKLKSRAEIAEEFAAIDCLYKSQLEREALADETSTDFVETLYMHLTGEIYYTHNDLGSRAFDDRRTALPGATFRGGRPDYHPGADARTKVLMANVQQMLSQDEIIEYANIYEVRSDNPGEEKLGKGSTREIIYKTNRGALGKGLIEKRLAMRRPGYGSYMLVRVQAFKELGVNFADYRLLHLRSEHGGRDTEYYIRSRCPGETLEDIPERMFQKIDGGEGEDPRVVLAICSLLGDAAAQNIVMKKHLPDCGCRFGEGKEVFEFGYNVTCRREMPVRVAICSMRGSLGWNNLEETEENLRTLFDFYLESFAKVFVAFWQKHRDTVGLKEAADRFWDGFEFKTRSMHWLYSASREQFDAFDPCLPRVYDFGRKWRFALWSLDKQAKHIDQLKETFHAKVRTMAK